MDIKRIKSALNYDAETGILTWKARRGSAQKGDVAGCLSTRGALVIRFDGKLHYAHRIAWAITHNEWPSGVIDHVNNNPTDNRLCNLRDCTQSQNMQNMSKHRDTASGMKGVYREKKKWCSKIYVKGRSHHLGTFETPIEAANAYNAAALQNFGSFAKLSGA